MAMLNSQRVIVIRSLQVSFFVYTIYSIWLVVAANPSEQYDLVSWDHEIPNWNGKS